MSTNWLREALGWHFRHPRVEAWKVEERRGPGGRPETFPAEAVLDAPVIAAVTHQARNAVVFRDILFARISPRLRAALGVPNPPRPGDLKGWAATYRNVRTRLHGLVELMDPSVLPKNRRLPAEDFDRAVQRISAVRSEEFQVRNAERLTWFCNQILEASIQLLPREHRRKWKGSIAVDATPVPAFARMPRQRFGKQWGTGGSSFEIHSSDPDAGFYRRERDVREDHAERVLTAKTMWAYEDTLAVSGPDGPDDEFRIATLVVGMAPLHRPGSEPGQNAIKAVRSVSERGHPANWLAADRAYSSAKPEDFQLPAMSLGYKAIFDYKIDQLGIKDEAQGFIQVEGAKYCPSMPQIVIDATWDFRKGRITEEIYALRLEKRKKYRARPKGRPDADGYQRFECPAEANGRCPLKPESLRTPRPVPVTIRPTARVSANPPKCCTQKSHRGAAAGREVPPGAALRDQGVGSVLLDTPQLERGYERVHQGRCPRGTRRSQQTEDPRGCSPELVRGVSSLCGQCPEDRRLPPAGSGHQDGVGHTASSQTAEPVARRVPTQFGDTSATGLSRPRLAL